MQATVQPDWTARTMLLVDDHPLFRTGLRTLLLREAGTVTVLEAGSCDEAIAHTASAVIDVALVDVLLPVLDGTVVTGRLHALQPATKILGLSMVDEPLRIAAMLKAGAVGYVLKLQPVLDVIAAIRTVLTGARYLPPSVSSAEIDDGALLGALGGLTRREREVLVRLVHGHSNHRIAAELFISRRTVESHRQGLLKKFDVHTIVDLLHIAVRAGLVEN